MYHFTCFKHRISSIFSNICSTQHPLEDIEARKRSSPVDDMAVLRTMLGSQFVAGLTRVRPQDLKHSRYDRECAVCNTTFGPNTQDAVQLACEHVFCRDCLTQWCHEDKAYKTSCPTCRRELFRKPDEIIRIDAESPPLLPPANSTNQIQAFDFSILRTFSDREILLIWFEAHPEDRVGTDMELYDRLSNEGAVPPRQNPARTIPSLMEEMTMFAALQRRPGTFALRRDDSRHSRWLVYIDGIDEPYEIRNYSEAWTEDKNEFLLSGIRENWGTFGEILNLWLLSHT